MLADSKANMFNSTVTAAFKVKVFLKLLPPPVPPLSSLLQLTPLTSHIFYYCNNTTAVSTNLLPIDFI